MGVNGVARVQMKNIFKYIILFLSVFLISYLWNESFVYLFRKVNFIRIIVDYPIFLFSGLFNIVIIVSLCFIVFINRGEIKTYVNKLVKGLIVFGPLQQHYLILILLSIVISSLVVHPKLYQTSFLFNGDFLIAILLSIIFSTLIKQNKNDACPQVERNKFDESPIENFEEDRLDFLSLVENITTYIISRENGQNAVSIELRGKWGSGKTSVLNLLELFILDQQKKNEIPGYNRIRTLKINVSKFEKVTLLYLHFFYEVIRKLEEEFVLPRIDLDLILTSIFERTIKGINISALQNRTMKLPKVEKYLVKISNWLCQTNILIVCYLDDIDRLSINEIKGVLKLMRIVKYNMKNLVLIASSDLEIYRKFYEIEPN